MKNVLELVRKERGVLQESLAKAVGVSRQTIVGIESGKCTPNVTVALRIAKFFGMSVDDIFYLDEDEGWVFDAPENENFKKNSKIAINRDFIFGQNSVSDFTYAGFSLSFNGGEIVALYNALLLSGRYAPLESLILEFEENKLYMLGGFGGTDPKKIGIYLAVHAVPYIAVTSERDLRDKLVGETCAPFILSYVDIKPSPKPRVIHTVAGIKDGDGFRLYNVTGKEHEPVYYDSYLRMKKGKKIIVSYIFRD